MNETLAEVIRKRIAIHHDMRQRGGVYGGILFISRRYEPILKDLPADEFVAKHSGPEQTPGLLGYWSEIPVILAPGVINGPGWCFFDVMA